MKLIKIDTGRCTGCRSCEAICSAFHAKPRYSIVNPKRSRIGVFIDKENDVYLPVIAGPHTDIECVSKNIIIINGEEYPECVFCRASCPSRDLFKDPDSGLPLRCDSCGQCIKWCLSGALTFVDR